MADFLHSAAPRSGDPAVTIKSVLDETRGRGRGFDFLRLALAISILIWHCFVTSYGPVWSLNVLHGPWRALIFSLVPAFFALSGFLVAGSLERTGKLWQFLTFRILRIYPALVTETIVTAVVLGACATSLPLKDYFSSPRFADYMLNMIGWVHFQLPGVFQSNPWPQYVNFSLWTIPTELKCYILLLLIIPFSVTQKRIPLLICVLLSLVIKSASLSMEDASALDDYVPLVRPMMTGCFTCGVLFYFWRDRIRLTRALFALCLLCYCLSWYLYTPLVFSLGELSITYVTLYVGLLPPPEIRFLAGKDYSYGTYLYACPMQQMVVWLFPNLREFYYVFLLSTPLTFTCAMLSWHFVEKPALALKKKIMPKAVTAAHL